MVTLTPKIDESLNRPIYLQIYDYIKDGIVSGNMAADEKLPSLRNLSKALKLSITTINLAYSQLNMEGYIYSKPQSGYFVSNISFLDKLNSEAIKEAKINGLGNDDLEVNLAANRNNFALFPIKPEKSDKSNEFQYDLSCFDFVKWKKCMNKVLTEFPQMLLFESEPTGEPALRYEIAKYVYEARGVKCTQSQIVIAAGTQQITAYLCLILTKMGINHVAVEEPGYLPVKNMFKDRGFNMSSAKVNSDGIEIPKLPANIKSAVYVSPSNQFPTGAVMSVGKRYELLKWAENNSSIIIEDDYDSELRYFGKPIPALQGMDTKECVVYLGSFSSTLFSSIKISYMVLPKKMAEIFQQISRGYTQTCSKTEQLTLALFMEQGFYQTHIKKVRNLYSQKLQRIIWCINKYGREKIILRNNQSGINLILEIKTSKNAEELALIAKSFGVTVVPVESNTENKAEENTTNNDVGKWGGTSTEIVMYYNGIPIEKIESTIKKMVEIWLRDNTSPYVLSNK